MVRTNETHRFLLYSSTWSHQSDASRCGGACEARQLREVLEDVPLNSYDVMGWIGEYLREQYEESSEDDGNNGEE